MSKEPTKAEKLANEFRLTMPSEVMQLWGADAQAELRRQHDEIAELQKDIAHKDAFCEQLGRDLSKATAEIEALRKDAKRYRWLRCWVARLGKPPLYVSDGSNPIYEERLDEAIDSAVAAAPAPPAMGEKA